MTKTRIDLLRHGLPEGGHRYRGHGIDDALSETGWRQMWAAVGDDWPWDGIFCSPMARCRPFAEELGRSSGLRVVVDERLRVHGISQLRVADCSIMPQIVSGNTNAPAMMIGEKTSDMVLADSG